MSDQRPGRPLIVPVFIPFQGCPHRCIYCDQEKITSETARNVDRSTVKALLDRSLRTPSFNAATKREVAFYGGTFTRLPRAKMFELLEAVAPYLSEDMFQSVRLSTRPDALDDERLLLLRRFRVETVELGVQSMDEEVLRLSRRGHGAEDTVRSVYLLRRHGFKVGVQLMPGLPGDSAEKWRATVDKVIDLRPDMIRLYPTVVIEGTELARRHRSGEYQAWDLEKALQICTESVLKFEGSGIPVIRIGLMSSPSLRRPGHVLAGPWHEAFGHMVRSEVYHRKIEPFLPRWGEADRIRLKAHPKEVSLMRGYANRGIRTLEMKTGATVCGVSPDASLSPGRIEVEKSCNSARDL
jgi:histone acetyltransferase (RNA polymerase elongator complex component)